jgi:hypothetical protein
VLRATLLSSRFFSFLSYYITKVVVVVVVVICYVQLPL